MVKVSAKTVQMKLDIFPCGKAKATTNLTIACSEKGAQFKTTLSDYGLQKFKRSILSIYDGHIGRPRTKPDV